MVIMLSAYVEELDLCFGWRAVAQTRFLCHCRNPAVPAMNRRRLIAPPTMAQSMECGVGERVDRPGRDDRMGAAMNIRM